jgi:hypothetical protein
MTTSLASACAIRRDGCAQRVDWPPDESQSNNRKQAFNELQDQAPIHESSGLVLGHSDIPSYLQREWFELNFYTAATKSVTLEEDQEAALRRYSLTDKEMGFGRFGRSPRAPDQNEDPAPAHQKCVQAAPPCGLTFYPEDR